jgi:hypothetical protein
MDANKAMNFVNNLNTMDDTNIPGNSWLELQRAVSTMGLNEKPVVLNDNTFDSQNLSDVALGGVELYRGLVGNSRVNLTASDIVESVKFGDNTIVGKGIHSDGFYFTTRQSTADMYSDGTPNSSLTAYIDKSKAKTITESKLLGMYRRESAGGRIKMDLSTYALYKGYNVIHVPGGNNGGHTATTRNRYAFNNGGEDYYVPLIRSVMVIREHTKLK